MGAMFVCIFTALAIAANHLRLLHGGIHVSPSIGLSFEDVPDPSEVGYPE